MAREFEDSMSPSFSSNINIGEFECNICFEVAQDPLVTLCGHLYCWPCLYIWLHNHSHCQECPVCKAFVKEANLVPVYGRGKRSSYPRPYLIPGSVVPNRPAGQRSETASSPPPPPPPNASYFHQDDYGSTGGLIPMASARIGNFTVPATSFGGLIRSLYFHVSGVYDGLKFLHWFLTSLHGGHHVHGSRIRSNQQQRRDFLWTMWWLFVFGFALIVAVLLLLVKLGSG